jgi:hypothetical protein
MGESIAFLGNGWFLICVVLGAIKSEKLLIPVKDAGAPMI